MKTKPNSANRFILLILPIFMLALAPVRAQVITNVSTAAELATALNQAFLYSQGAGNVLTNRITLSGNISANAQMIVNANVVIDGAGFSIDMNNADRAFFVAGGNVAISNLTIQNGNATGGSGGIGGGGGAGLGGAIFVGSGSYSGWTTDDNPQPIVAAQGVSVPSVTLSAVSFASNTATGGDSAFYFADGFDNGGGGMGGDSSGGGGGGDGSGGGGGGFGNSAAGGSGSGNAGAAGAFVNVSPTSGNTLAAGAGGNGSSGNGGAGGANGGGGGNGGSGLENVGSGGGGGVGAGRGYFVNSDPPNSGGNGGFGGGGGGAAVDYGGGGAGGFGGGGGGSLQSGGNGGFGGGGGKASSGSPGAGGFGAASATAPGGSGQNSAAGGGLGAGGAVFVMAGATLTVQDGIFSSNSVTGGSGGDGNNGSAYGADLFLGGNVTFNVSSNLTVNSLGGAGNLSDPNVSGNANDPNAQGGIVKTGAGNLTLTGTNYYTGVTTVNAGTLTLAPGAKEIGTQLVTVGQNNGDNATLVLGSSANLTLRGFNATTNGTDAPVMIAQSAGSTGTIVTGNGAGSSGADIGAQVFTGGAGDATVRFTQQYAAGSASNTIYPFYTTLTGSLGVTQAGAGTTQLQPLYGTNTFTGEVAVESGTLSTAGAVAALAGTTGITINGGALTLGQTGGVNDSASVDLNGGALQTGISLTETMGALTINGPSRIDFMGNSSALTFSDLTIIDTLAIWNYSPDDTLTILSGAALGDLGNITFYSDSGTTAVGTAMFDGNDIMPVPEPSTYALLALAAAALGAHVIRRRKRAKVS